MPKKLVKTTYFIACTEEVLYNLQQGTAVQRLAVKDYHADGTVEEIWVEIQPIKEKEAVSTTPAECPTCNVDR